MHFDETHKKLKKVRPLRPIDEPLHPFDLLVQYFFGLIFPLPNNPESKTMPLNNRTSHFSQRPYLQSTHAVLKICTLLYLCMVSILAYFFHADSPWVRRGLWYQCKLAKETKTDLVWTDEGYAFKVPNESLSCPSVAHERFFVYSAWIVIVATLVNVIASCVAEIETVNVLRKRDAFINIVFCIGLFTGGVLYIISPITMQDMKCVITNLNGTSAFIVDKAKSRQTCSKYFLNSNKIAAGSLAIIAGMLYGALACVLDNTRLFGMDAGALPTTRNSIAGCDAEDGLPPPRQSLLRSRRSSVNNVSQRSTRKGVGSFGAVTSNIGQKDRKRSASEGAVK